MNFLTALMDPHLMLLRYALMATVLASGAFGVIGTYVVARRISYIAGAISHSVLGGIGFSLYMQYHYGLLWLNPLVGSLGAALLSAIIIGYVSLHQKEREDTIIGAIWSVGMAMGLIFIAKTPGYMDPMSYLFGNILMISRWDLWCMVGLDVLILTSALLLYHKYQALFFDEEFSRLRGVRVEAHYILLLCLIAVAIVMLTTVVGIVLVIALLTLPAATSGSFSRKMWQMMLWATLIAFVCCFSGLWYSYDYDLPTGPVIILVAAASYFLVKFSEYLILRWRRVS